MRILLTGAAGFIGSHVAERLLVRGHEVVGLDNFDPFYDVAIKQRNLAPLAGRAGWRLVRGEILDGRAVADAMEGADLVCHLAALAGVRPSLADPARYHRVNVDGTLALAELCRARGVSRFVFGSSSSVYGAGTPAPFREDDACARPASPYAATKRAGEQYARAYSAVYGLGVTVLRFFTVYGPRQRPEMAIHKFARLIEAGRSIPFYGDGTSARDYTYVDDIVDGVVAAIERAGVGHRVYNLGDGRPIALVDLVAHLERALGRRATLDRQPEQTGDVPLTFASIDAARAGLGYEPKVPIEEGLARFVEWLRAGSSG